MYPEGQNAQPTTVSIASMTRNLCGRSRPTHFDGVTTVVSKLFNMVDPDVAVFGAKDYQQLAVLRRMTHDLNFDIDIVGGPTHREEDGVARSSRNRNIRPQYRDSAIALSRGLAAAWSAFQKGERNGDVLGGLTREVMVSYYGVAIDYVECVHPDTLAPLSGPDAGTAHIGDDRAVMAVAARLGPVRLIDNLQLGGPLPAEVPQP
jgi:pantoate--beta-alanine ligase